MLSCWGIMNALICGTEYESKYRSLEAESNGVNVLINEA